MAEDTWFKCEREYFVMEEAASLGMKEKKLNEIIEKYNRYLQKALFGLSPYVAEDLKRTIEASKGEDERK